ncbi:MAG: DNA-binding response regulator [Candidatus Aeolococcus gillhamiae]|uniref:DNA-binding response regulator n=1 Tax=Candidatus Aeolococcus gillhamiae TaxID=3127015 RepID=A0A2W5Z3A1_9BACT|nr:MAG: DNA-binding response regulator [Candidatus Dormibacter sp. RRmetagenome_bin12]
MRLLVAEDDAALRSVLVRGLIKHGYVVDATERGDDALLLLASNRYAAAIVDWRMPGLEGTDVVSRARQRGDATPVLMLTARDLSVDRVEGLDAGADDYLVKPFDFAELLARLRALLRRPPLASAPVLRVGDLSLDPSTHEVRSGERSVSLTPLEYAVLEILLRRAPHVASRAVVAEHAWSAGESISMNALEAHVARLRAKLVGSGLRISAVRGVGYRIVAT